MEKILIFLFELVDVFTDSRDSFIRAYRLRLRRVIMFTSLLVIGLLGSAFTIKPDVKGSLSQFIMQIYLYINNGFLIFSLVMWLALLWESYSLWRFLHNPNLEDFE